jgi:nucleoid-associated protein YgaU
MPAVTLTLPAVPAGAAPAGRVQAELTVIGTPDTVIVLPITDPEASFKGLAPAWEQIPRPGRKPILVRAGQTLTTLDLKVTVAAPDGGRLDPDGTVESVLELLTFMASTDSESQPIALTWGGFDSSPGVTSTGLWHLQDIEINSELRQPGTNNVTRAEVTLTLVEASDPPSAAGNSNPGWAKPPAPPAPVPSSTTAWIVQAGDTAYSIAAAVYGSPEPGWRTLLAANGITNPTALSAGTVLTIP